MSSQPNNSSASVDAVNYKAQLDQAASQAKASPQSVSGVDSKEETTRTVIVDKG